MTAVKFQGIRFQITRRGERPRIKAVLTNPSVRFERIANEVVLHLSFAWSHELSEWLTARLNDKALLRGKFRICGKWRPYCEWQCVQVVQVVQNCSFPVISIDVTFVRHAPLMIDARYDLKYRGLRP